MTEVFFTSTKRALNNITSTFDMIWPISVGLWNLRCMVNGVRKEYPNVTESELTAKFSQGSGIHGVNYKRAFTQTTWEQQQTHLAWILLNNTIPVFEGWLEELKQDYFADMKIKDLQFPQSAQVEVTRLISNPSALLKNAFYSTYCGKRDRCYSNINSLLSCYRVFKEARNCYMHNGSVADQKLIDAYNNYKQATTSSLCVSEVPEFPMPCLGSQISISLRGVVGFSYIIIKLLVTLDTELLQSANAEKEFIARYKSKHTIMRTLKADVNASRRQVKQYVKQCGFPSPKNIDDIITFLVNNCLVTRQKSTKHI